jgi:hypothetical protein
MVVHSRTSLWCGNSVVELRWAQACTRSCGCVLISFLFFRWKHSRIYASLMCINDFFLSLLWRALVSAHARTEPEITYTLNCCWSAVVIRVYLCFFFVFFLFFSEYTRQLVVWVSPRYRELDLSSNQVSVLPPGIFAGLSSFKWVCFSWLFREYCTGVKVLNVCECVTVCRVYMTYMTAQILVAVCLSIVYIIISTHGRPCTYIQTDTVDWLAKWLEHTHSSTPTHTCIAQSYTLDIWLICGGHRHAHVHVHACLSLSFSFGENMVAFELH